MRRQLAGLVAAAIAASTFPSVAIATEFACTHAEKVFAKKTIILRRTEVEAFNRRFTAWGMGRGYTITGGAIGNPGEKDYWWDAILQSKSYGTAVTIQGRGGNDTATVQVKNNCWAPEEDWRPYWSLVTGQLAQWGYRDAGK